jgi:hypothetical protein
MFVTKTLKNNSRSALSRENTTVFIPHRDCSFFNANHKHKDTDEIECNERSIKMKKSKLDANVDEKQHTIKT